ncbi:uncharacterized protein MELLADRAFT_71426 [Melampsora larici-populina 98AG31]|uniref:Uncharacterized protein n=1 Tax=Melampsora larici-populina (strain 98AG31 / pathotype 3-4-7) TaxID=747676 RepID=F4RGK1_MELLP|nr:uncharacterized protein MELLADRAFT_71426 [Melampsora larici-populina 98AG31]EGG08636.1 hypothetical protein MELLADRAFT_71426 [Melampsora larici-populina 98AG31]
MVRSESTNLNATLPPSANSIQSRTVTQIDHTKAIHPTLLTSRRSLKAKGTRLKRDDFGFKEPVTIMSRFHLVLHRKRSASASTTSTSTTTSSTSSLSSSTSSNASIY